MDDNDNEFTVEENMANIRVTISELDLLMYEETDKARVDELRNLKQQLVDILTKLTNDLSAHQRNDVI